MAIVELLSISRPLSNLVVVLKTCMAMTMIDDDVAPPKSLTARTWNLKTVMITLNQEIMMTLKMMMMKKRRRQ